MNLPQKEKKKFPAELGKRVAALIIVELEKRCLRLKIAGSLRRGKPMIGDLEILYVPKREIRKDPKDMFADIFYDLPNDGIAAMERDGFLAKRKNANGSEVFGPKNKLMVHVESGLPVDLFSSTEESWFNYLVCRTGPMESNIRIADAAKKRGWKWNPYGSGFSQGDTTHIVNSEKDVFDFVGLPYYEPEHRR